MMSARLKAALWLAAPLLALLTPSRAQEISPGPEIQLPPPIAGAPSAPAPLDAFSAVGSEMAMANHIGEMGWSDAQIEAFLTGLRAAIHGKPYPFSDASHQIGDWMNRRIAEIEAHEKEAKFADPATLRAYMKDICKRLKLDQSDSGLAYMVQSGGTGIRPGPEDTVVVTCVATAADGTTVLPQLSSQKVRVKVAESLPGFVEGLQMMSVGGRALFVMPPDLTFGDGKWPPGVVRGSPLIFQVTLEEVGGADAPK